MISDLMNPYIDSMGWIRFGTKSKQNALRLAKLGKKSAVKNIQNGDGTHWWMVIIYKPRLFVLPVVKVVKALRRW